MTELKPEHVRTHANLYVIQWRWGVKKNEKDLTQWQTITIRNKLYAILKHLLSPGRYYRFRVAAVNRHGSQGFSEPSPYFKLSKSPKAPGKPRNLEVGKAKLTSNGLLSQEIRWLPPSSDLPIVHYQVTWVREQEDKHSSTPTPPTETTDAILNDMPGTQAEALKSVDEEKEDFMSSYRKTELIPAVKNSLQLEDLKAGAKYRIEVQAIVEGEDSDEIMGDTASIVIFTSADGTPEISTEPISSPKPKVAERKEESHKSSPKHKVNGMKEESEKSEENNISPAEAVYPEVSGLLVHKPFFQNGLLKAAVDWTVSNEVGTREEYKFEVTWSPVVCLGEANLGFSGGKPLSAYTSATTYELYDLQFGCHYTANVSTVFLRADSAYAKVPGLSVLFETPSCQNTPVQGSVAPDCPTLPPNVPSKPQNLSCSSEPSKSSVTTVCSWSEPARSDKPIQGFRVLTGKKLSHNYGIGNSDPFPSIDQNTVSIRFIEDGSSRIKLESLLVGTEYVIQVQAFSEVGLGPSIYKTFSTPSRLPKRKNGPLGEKEKATMVYNTDESEDRIVFELDEDVPNIHSKSSSSSTSINNTSSSVLLSCIISLVSFHLLSDGAYVLLSSILRLISLISRR